MRAEKSPDHSARFVGMDSEQILTYRQIGFIGWKTDTSVERTDDGFRVGTEWFVPTTDS